MKSGYDDANKVINKTEGYYFNKIFEEIDRRPYIPFPGSHDTGDFILMMKNLK